jgi:hypothetical protein
VMVHLPRGRRRHVVRSTRCAYRPNFPFCQHHTYMTDGLWGRLPRRRLHDVREESLNTTDNTKSRVAEVLRLRTEPTNEKTKIKAPSEKRTTQPTTTEAGEVGDGREHTPVAGGRSAQEAGAGGRTRDCVLSPFDATFQGLPYHRMMGGASIALKNACEFWALHRSSLARRSYFLHYDAATMPLGQRQRRSIVFLFRRRLRLFLPSERRAPCWFCWMWSLFRHPCAPWCWLRPRARSPAASLAGCMPGGWEWTGSFSWWCWTRRRTGDLAGSWDRNGQSCCCGVCFEDLLTLGQGSTSPGGT